MARLLAPLLLLACLLAPQASANSAAFALSEDQLSESWTVHVPTAQEVRFSVDVANGVYLGLTLDGPGTCQGVDIGTGAAQSTVLPSTRVDVSCGVVPLGWYKVTLTLGDGMVGGHLRSTGATLLYD